MTSDKRDRRWGRIPIRFSDAPPETESADDVPPLTGEDASFAANASLDAAESAAGNAVDLDAEPQHDDREKVVLPVDDVKKRHEDEASGPVFAELLATRAELKRLEAEVADYKDKFARRQADFENFRKRVDRERADTYNRAVADLVMKLLPVVDNLGRALDTEASVEASESDEFRHFLSGVDLIHKQLGGVLETLGVKTVSAVGEQFNPHLHEAVVTEETDEFEPDVVMQEIVRGYRLGDKLLRPALVKVAIKK
jgi:molecular chaperone GrpE